MLSNLTGATPALALTCTALPGVDKTAPRGEFTLKKSNGRLLGAAKLLGTPSQFISRRPDPNEPPTFGLSLPRSVRNVSTAAWISAAVAPLADRIDTANVRDGKLRKSPIRTSM